MSTRKRERSTKSSSEEEVSAAATAGVADETSQQSNKKRGWDAIESLFDDKKKDKKERIVEQQEHKKLVDEYRKQPKVEPANSNTKFGTKEKWADDGLGGKYNAEGFTGRVQDGVKVFKAHLLSKPGAGSTDECPFDCDCCYM
jgi:hypothetical protein